MKRIKKTLVSLLLGAASTLCLVDKVNAQDNRHLFVANESGSIKEFSINGTTCIPFGTFKTLGAGASPQMLTFSPWNNNLLVAVNYGVGKNGVFEYDRNGGNLVHDYAISNNAYGLDYGTDKDLFTTSGFLGNPGDPGIGEVYRFDGQTRDFLGLFISANNSGGLN